MCFRLMRGFAAVVSLLIGVAGFSPLANAKDPWPGGLDLEDAAAGADLIVVVRVSGISEAKTIHGGKAVEVSRQFQFQPVRVLKGVFARPELSLTDRDLGQFGSNDEAVRLEKGQLRLLFLGRSDQGYVNANQAQSLDRSLPPLDGLADPLLASVETLIAMAQQPDRFQRVRMLVDALGKAKGPGAGAPAPAGAGAGAVALLHAIARRPLIAAQTKGTIEALAPFLADADSAVGETAARALSTIIDADYREQKPFRTAASQAIENATKDRHINRISHRTAIIDALGALGSSVALGRVNSLWLELTEPGSRTSYAEQGARLRAVARVRNLEQAKGVSKDFDLLPLDASDELELAAGLATEAIAPAEAPLLIATRLGAKHSAGLEIRTELDLLAKLPAASAVPALLEAAKLPLDEGELASLASACRERPDNRFTPILARLLDPRRPAVRWIAIEALMHINTIDSALALRPHLAEEWDLGRKLRIAEFLGSHGFRDGYPYAIEHLSEPRLMGQAVAALAAIRDPSAGAELRGILESSHDLAWNSAAIRALGRLGAKDLSDRFLERAKNPRDPLAHSALLALADLGETRALPIVREAIAARDPATIEVAVQAAGKLLLIPEVKADDLRDQLASILADSGAPERSRSLALESLARLNDPRLDKALVTAIRDGGIERLPLLLEIEQMVRVRKLDLSL